MKFHDQTEIRRVNTNLRILRGYESTLLAAEKFRCRNVRIAIVISRIGTRWLLFKILRTTRQTTQPRRCFCKTNKTYTR